MGGRKDPEACREYDRWYYKMHGGKERARARRSTPEHKARRRLLDKQTRDRKKSHQGQGHAEDRKRRGSVAGLEGPVAKTRVPVRKDPFGYSVYVYVFDDSKTYVSLTSNVGARRRAHGDGKKMTAVMRYSLASRLPIPDMLILYRDLSASEAQRTEDIIRSSIAPSLCLNTAATGVGVGSIGSTSGIRRSKENKARQNRLAARRFLERCKADPVRYEKLKRQWAEQRLKQKLKRETVVLKRSGGRPPDRLQALNTVCEDRKC